MGFFSDLGQGFVQGITSGDFISSAFSTLANAGLGLLQSDIQQDQLDQERADSREKLLLDLKLKQLEAMYGNRGGGGGGGAGKLTTAQKLSAIQNQTDAKIDAINNMITATQTGILGGR